jgi:5-methyltetrahydropteroyltriglutamate--homocysteine methyltransferase
MAVALLRTTVVGSYPQPDWLINKPMLRGQFVPRVKAGELWRVEAEVREEALRDATTISIRDMESAGVDVLTDGEICRESYTNHFVTALAGVDSEQPAAILNRAGRELRVPRVVGPVRHQAPVEVTWARFLRAQTRRLAKVTLPGPFTLAQQVKDEYYGDAETLAMEFAAALNVEAHLLQETGVDVIQFDEPWLRNNPKAARAFGVRSLDRALEGLRVGTAVHVCFGYAFLRKGQKPSSYEYLTELASSAVQEISIEAAQPGIDLGVLKELPGKRIALGVLDHSTPEAEPVEVVARRIRAALSYVTPERLSPAPDCGMKYMSRDVAFSRLKNLCVAAAEVRRELCA